MVAVESGTVIGHICQGGHRNFSGVERKKSIFIWGVPNFFFLGGANDRGFRTALDQSDSRRQ